MGRTAEFLAKLKLTPPSYKYAAFWISTHVVTSTKLVLSNDKDETFLTVPSGACYLALAPAHRLTLFLLLCAPTIIPARLQTDDRHRQLAKGHGRDDGNGCHDKLHALRPVVGAAHAVDPELVPRPRRVRDDVTSCGHINYAKSRCDTIYWCIGWF